MALFSNVLHDIIHAIYVTIDMHPRRKNPCVAQYSNSRTPLFLLQLPLLARLHHLLLLPPNLPRYIPATSSHLLAFHRNPRSFLFEIFRRFRHVEHVWRDVTA